MTTLPTVPTVTEIDPTTLPVATTGRDGRGRETLIPTSDPAVFLAVFTYHVGRSQIAGRAEYRYVSSIMAIRKGPRFVLSAPMSAAVVEIVPGARRYTDKGVTAAHAAAVTTVAEHLRGGETFARLLEQVPTER